MDEYFPDNDDGGHDDGGHDDGGDDDGGHDDGGHDDEQTKFDVNESRRNLNRMVKRWNRSLMRQIRQLPGGEMFVFVRCVARKKKSQEEYLHASWLGTEELTTRCLDVLKDQGLLEVPREVHDPRIQADEGLLNPEVPKTFIERSKKARDLVRWAWNLVNTEKSKHMYSLVGSGKAKTPGWWTHEFGTQSPFTSHEVGQRCVRVIEILTDDRRDWMKWEPGPEREPEQGIEPPTSGNNQEPPNPPPEPEVAEPAAVAVVAEPAAEPGIELATSGVPGLGEPTQTPISEPPGQSMILRPKAPKPRKPKKKRVSKESKARAARTSKRVKKPSVLAGYECAGECKKLRQFK